MSEKANNLYSEAFFNNVDLNIVSCGFQKKNKEHSFSMLFDHNVLQYVVDGEGTFLCDGKKYSVKKGDLFLLPYGSQCHYYANKTNPYCYYWVGFFGVRAKNYLDQIGISDKKPVLSINNDDIKNAFSDTLNAYKIKTEASTLLALSCLYKIIALLISITRNSKNEKPINNYIKESIIYMHEHYNQPITIYDVANHLNLDRTYFYSIFKREMNCSPKEYLTNYRIMNAKSLLIKTDYPIAYIGQLIGMPNQINFSAQFKKIVHISPLNYRKRDINGRKAQK